MKPRIALFFSIVIAFGAFAPAAPAQPTRTIVVQQFDDAPDGQGGSDTNFDQQFQDPALNDNGQISFSAELLNGFNGIYRTDGATTVQIARWGDPAPDTGSVDNGFFGFLLGKVTWLNDNGQVAFRADIVDSGGIGQGHGVWIGDGTDLAQVIRSGQQAPDGNGTFFASGSSANIEGFNDRGEIVFRTRLDATTQGLDDDDIVLRGSASGLETVAREGTDFDVVGGPVKLGPTGHVLLRADPDIDNPPDAGLYVWTGTSYNLIAAPYDTPSPGGFEFETVGAQAGALNASDEVAWKSTLRNAMTGDFEGRGIFVGSPSGIVRIARTGDAAPDGTGGFDGTFSDVNGNLEIPLNDAGQVAFVADLEGNSGGFEGLFRGDGGETVAIARVGDPAPDGNGSFNGIGSFAIDALGRVIFSATLTGTDGGSGDDTGLFLYDDTAGLMTVVREDGPLDGATVEQFLPWLPPGPIENAGFNNLSQAAFGFSTTIGIQGIALYDPDLQTEPPPPPVENCVNGVDDDGDGDVDSDDADCPEKLLVRCLHDPLFPAESSQTVRLRAEAVDQDGQPFEAASVEVWRETDTQSPAAAANDSDIVDLVLVADDDFGYACRAEHNGLTAFSGWRRVQAGGSIVGFPAEPVLFNGPFDRKIDLVFFASEFDYSSVDDPEFLRDVRNLLYEGYFRIPWFIEHQDMFNVWIGTDFGNARPTGGASDPCVRQPPSNLRRDYLFAQVAGIVHSSVCRDNAGAYEFTIETQPGRLEVLAHESGHKPFGLPDEYCCDGGYYTLPKFSSLYVDQPACWSGAVALGFDPEACTAFTDVDSDDWWLFEPRKKTLSPQPGDLMQQSGCTIPADPAWFPILSHCTQVSPDFSGTDPDPNGLLACAEYGQTYFTDPDGLPDSDDENIWLCTRAGNANNSVWVDRSHKDRYRIGDSERMRMTWFLNRCLAREC